jgi:hypothetical protein
LPSACISSIIRITFIPKMLVDPDATWAISGAMYWSVIETNIGILAASIPSFKALAKRYLPVLLGEYSSNERYGSTNPKSGSGPFHKISYNTSQGTSKGDSKAVKMMPLSNKDNDAKSVTGGFAKNGMNTTIEQDRISNESEEMLNVPQGRIVARTQITTQVEGSDEEAGSFYSHEQDVRAKSHSGKGF